MSFDDSAALDRTRGTLRINRDDDALRVKSVWLRVRATSAHFLYAAELLLVGHLLSPSDMWVQYIRAADSRETLARLADSKAGGVWKFGATEAQNEEFLIKILVF